MHNFFFKLFIYLLFKTSLLLLSFFLSSSFFFFFLSFFLFLFFSFLFSLFFFFFFLYSFEATATQDECLKTGIGLHHPVKPCIPPPHPPPPPPTPPPTPTHTHTLSPHGTQVIQSYVCVPEELPRDSSNPRRSEAFADVELLQMMTVIFQIGNTK